MKKHKTALEKAFFSSLCPYQNKYRLFINSRKLYALLEPKVSYDEFSTMIYWSSLCAGNDYHYSYDEFKSYNLSISALQAVLVMYDTDKSWQLFHELNDLIASEKSLEQCLGYIHIEPIKWSCKGGKNEQKTAQ